MANFELLTAIDDYGDVMNSDMVLYNNLQEARREHEAVKAEYEAYKKAHPSAKDAQATTASTNFGGADAVPDVEDKESFFVRLWRWLCSLFGAEDTQVLAA